MSNAKATTKASNPEPPIPSQDCGWLSVYDEEEIFPRCFHGNPQRNRRCPAALSILWAPTGTKPPERTVSLVFSQLRSLSLVFFLLFLSLLCSLVLLHPRVHYLEMTSDSSWPPDLTAYTFFGYNIGDLPFLLAKSSLLVETIKERKKPVKRSAL